MTGHVGAFAPTASNSSSILIVPSQEDQYNTVAILERVAVSPMISFEGFAIVEGSPIYLQIIRYVKWGIASGRIRDGDELPSRRMLSALLGVNPNTVQKAYRLLEEEGIVSSHTGAKSLVTAEASQVPRIRSQLLQSDARALAAAMKQLGVAKNEAIRLLEQVWDQA